MPRHYKSPNGCVHKRGRGGRFERWTMNDFGMGFCPDCRHVMIKKYPKENGMIDPRAIYFECNHCHTKVARDGVTIIKHGTLEAPKEGNNETSEVLHEGSG